MELASWSSISNLVKQLQRKQSYLSVCSESMLIEKMKIAENLFVQAFEIDKGTKEVES